MTRSDPPAVAVALLRRFLPENEPLVGDLFERFARNQSRFWFWRQVLAAIVSSAIQRRREERPLSLAEYLGSASPVARRHVSERRHIDLSASPLPDVGGLGLVALGVVVSLARPGFVWMIAAGVVGGAALGVTMTILRRHALLSGPTIHNRTLLRDP